jgi:hypothetical protein
MTPVHSHFTGLGGAIVVGLIAFSACFLVLGGLALIIYGIKYMAKVGERGGTDGGTPAKKAPLPVASPGALPVQTASAHRDVCGMQETVAAITGAILAARGGAEFCVRSIVPVAGGRARVAGETRRNSWETAALLENTGELEGTWNAPA